MFFNNLKIAIRSLWKNKTSSTINILGLTVGLSSCLLIALYVQNEASYDKFQPNAERIARVIMEYRMSGPELRKGNFTSTKVAPVFSRTFPEVEAAIRMTDKDMIVKSGDNLFTEPNFLYADSTFFRIFDFKMRQGNPTLALNGPRKVVLAASAAKRYFGEESPLGKILLMDTDKIPYEVTGVMEDYPSNSQIKFDFIASFSSLGVNGEYSYFDANYTTYFLLKDKNSFASLQSKITPFMKKEMEGSGVHIDFTLEPFSTIHLHSEYGGFVPTTSVTYLYILSAVAVLILVIVCCTYINLSTARSLERAKEVGVRKTVGAARVQLFWQFISESAITCFFSIFLSVNVIVAVFPSFVQLIGKELSLSTLLSPLFLSVMVLVTIVVSLLAGSYPALMLSGFQPSKVLKGRFKNSDSGKWVQQSLIVFQFSIAVFLIGATLIMQNQLYFIQHKNLGYTRDQIMVLPMNEQVCANFSALKKELIAGRNVINVSAGGWTPVSILSGFNMRSSGMPENEQITVTANRIDENYVATTGLKIIAGSNISEQDLKDVSREKSDERIFHFIINETAAARLGWTPEEAIGKRMFLDNSRPGFVRGVVMDFNFESLHNAIRPLVLFPGVVPWGKLMIKIDGRNVPGAIAFIQSRWKQLAPNTPFDYRFLDDDYLKLYRSELQLGKVMNFFSAIAIVLGCLGLFGLSSYIGQQRTKEIGIRKILGASPWSIMGLLSLTFARPLLFSILLAIPLTWWQMKQWLGNFVYRIELQWWVFAVAGFSAIAIALLTVGIQSIDAAISNPVKSLQSE